MSKTVSFEFFDGTSSPKFPSPIDFEPSSPIESYNMRFIDSSTSINSLFDNQSKCSTATVTPTMSRSESELIIPSTKSPTAHNAEVIPNTEISHGGGSRGVAIILVGLPASGKSTVAKQMSEYLKKCNVVSNIYNAGDVRRKHAKFDNSDFFNPDNVQGKMDREKYANIAVTNLIDDINSKTTNVGFLDATNTTIDRRARMIEKIHANTNARIMIMDVQCNDTRLLNFNINGKAHNLDYKDKNYLTSIADFKLRSEHYFKVYEPVTAKELKNYPISMYLRIVNGGQFLQNSFIDEDFEKEDIFDTIAGFETDYFESEGKRYYEAVDAFYGISNQLKGYKS